MGDGRQLQNLAAFSKAFGRHASVFQLCKRLLCELPSLSNGQCRSYLINLLTGLVDKGDTVGTVHPAVGCI